MFGEHHELQLAVIEAKKRLRDVEFETSSADDTRSLLKELVELRAITGAAISRAVMRVEETNAHLASGHRDASSFVARLSGITNADALRELDTARKLQSLPDASEAFRNGSISSAQASLIAGAATDAKSEAKLLDVATKNGTAVLAEEARRLRAARSAQAEADDDARKRALRTVRLNTNREDGMVSLFALLLPEEGARVKAKLDRARDRIFREKHKKGIRDSFDHNMADAFIAVVDEASGGSKKRNVDAMVLVDFDALKRGHREPGETVEVAGCGTVSVATARELLDDAMFRVVVTDGIDIKMMTSKSRYWTSPVRTALELRDQRCCVPGCETRFRLQKDHQQWWSNNGETSYQNGRQICPHHHSLITNHGFRLEGVAGNWRWRAPGQLAVT